MMSEYQPLAVRCIGHGNLLLREICALVGFGRVVRCGLGAGAVGGFVVAVVACLRARLRLVMLFNAVVAGGLVAWVLGWLRVRVMACLLAAGWVRLLVVFIGVVGFGFGFVVAVFGFILLDSVLLFIGLALGAT